MTRFGSDGGGTNKDKLDFASEFMKMCLEAQPMPIIVKSSLAPSNVNHRECRLDSASGSALCIATGADSSTLSRGMELTDQDIATAVKFVSQSKASYFLVQDEVGKEMFLRSSGMIFESSPQT